MLCTSIVHNMYVIDLHDENSRENKTSTAMLPLGTPVRCRPANKMMPLMYQKMLQMKARRLDKEKKRARRRRQARIARRRQFEEENSLTMYFMMILMATSGIITVTNNHVRGLWSKQRTSVWWDSIVNGVFSDTEWLENFRMRRETFQFLCRCLAPHIRKKETIMRQPVSVEKRVAITLWRLVYLYNAH